MRSIRLTSVALSLLHLGCGSADPPASAPADAGAAGDVAPVSGLDPDEKLRVAKLSPLPELPKNPTNKHADDPAAAAFGQRLFFETGYAGPLAVAAENGNGGLGMVGEEGKISCASCHGGPGLIDVRSQPGTVSLGANYLARNSLGLVNASYYKWVNWAGRFSAQWELPIAVAENARNMNSSRLRVAHVIFDKYRADYEAVFGPLEPALGTDLARFPAVGKPKAAMAADGPWEAMAPADRAIVNRIFANFGKALEAYLRTLVSKTSRFDQFVAGNAAALTANEVAGLRVFVGKGRCVTCHQGPNFTDDDFHNIGVAQIGERVPPMDNGRFDDVPPLVASPFNSAGDFSDNRETGRLAGLVTPAPDSTRGQFRTPSLRNVAVTAPYMHAGQLKTLAEVVDYYDRGGDQPTAGSKDAQMLALALTAQEKADLVAFLATLTSDPLPARLLEDTSKK